MKTIMKFGFNAFLAIMILSFAGISYSIALPISAALATILNFIPTMGGSLFAGFIVNGSEFKGKELLDIILRPILQKELAKELGARVFLAIKSSVKLTFFGPTTKILKKYAAGWQGGAASKKNQKKLLRSEEHTSELQS